MAKRVPWRDGGLSEREAAAHALDRLAFGARPGEVDRVVALGVERWVEGQLGALSRPRPDAALLRRLGPLPALAMTAREIAANYPAPPVLLRRAERAGVVDRDVLRQRDERDARARREARRALADWMAKEGLRSERELLAQSYAWKVTRAVYAEDQLAERLADFWLDHFTVSTTDVAVRPHLLAYERDAIRPHIAGPFRELLEATAKHPAMLAYLDNFQSVADPGRPTLASGRAEREGRGPRRRGEIPPEIAARRPRGLNENYARELLELHTLGVDGGYTQHDIVEVARAFTGWSFVPPGSLDEEAAGRLDRAARTRRFDRAGLIVEGEFLFRADRHDAAAKSVLGAKLPSGRGIEDGEQVLDLAAAHPSTSRHLARKVATRFVSDEPPPALVDRLAAAFTASRGDLLALMRAVVESPEFWAAPYRGAKIKSPFEVTVSALRALGAEVDNPFPTVEWIGRMGQPLYACPAPTGFPDRADHWVNTGALLSRMNFGLELAAGRIGGVRFDLGELTGRREPESAGAALATFAGLLLPERDAAATVARLEPLLARPELPAKVAERSPEVPVDPLDEAASAGLGDFADLASGDPVGMSGTTARPERGASGRAGRAAWEGLDLYPPARAMHAASAPPSVVAGVVGLLLGSPEFQRC